MAKPHDKVEEEKKPSAKKPRGWRNFQRVLKQVINAPPIERHKPKSST